MSNKSRYLNAGTGDNSSWSNSYLNGQRQGRLYFWLHLFMYSPNLALLS